MRVQIGADVVTDRRVAAFLEQVSLHPERYGVPSNEQEGFIRDAASNTLIFNPLAVYRMVIPDSTSIILHTPTQTPSLFDARTLRTILQEHAVRNHIDIQARPGVLQALVPLYVGLANYLMTHQGRPGSINRQMPPVDVVNIASNSTLSEILAFRRSPATPINNAAEREAIIRSGI